ncbi:Peptidase [Flavobacterium sp. 9AF]|uniref:alpha/beta hydrolase family protein n=1 Tax=Flavobacterium sp. 9AF TaxID=2653142 RepID=UPI0012F34AE7|nr:prolyl oligopeptidase family serine peptidase [Flavobacterium sp. 9AF]VXB92083.1 Peptidase [Flavobacterium sp. 9AF]
MKYFKIIALVFVFISSYAQDKQVLIKKEAFTDFAKLPVYSKLSENENGKTVWKKSYQYLDSITIYNIQYLSDGLKVNGLLIIPKKSSKVPCIIYNRGGNQDFGALNMMVALRLGKLANEGYAIIASQYRGNAGGEGKEEFGGKDVNDVLRLIDVLVEEKAADTSKIGMYGWSRGGMMTYCALTKTNKIKAAVVGGALADLDAAIKDRPEMGTQLLPELVPNYKGNEAEEIKKRSAIQWVNKFSKNVPILLLHGNSDWRVKPEQSLRMALAFTEHRIPYRLIVFEGADHGITEFRDEVDEAVVDWFNKYLKEGATLPNMEYHGM